MTATTARVEHRYRPRGAAADLLRRRDPEILLSGPAGTGKSRAALEKLHLLMLLNPGARGLIVRKTLVSLSSTALVTWREHVVAEALASGELVYYGGSAEEPAQYRYANGSKVMVAGMDRSTRVMSSEYDCVYVQEAIELTEADWEALSTRLRNGRISFQQLIADTNPSLPTHWLKARCERGSTAMLESRHEDNPVLVDEDGEQTEAGVAYIGRLDKLTGPRRLRLRFGLWVAAEGVIYEMFDPAVHVIDRFEIPASWTRWWAVDFGYTNPLVLQRWAEDPDGRLFLYAEIYRTQRLVEDHARVVLDQVAPLDDASNRVWLEPRPRAIICDHDAEDRATLRKHLGMATTAAIKMVSPGIQAVMARLKPAGDGRHRLFILRDSCTDRDEALIEAKKPACTEEEIPGYIWAPGPDGKPVKEEPLKVDDHGSDCMRYMVAHLDLTGRPKVRVM
jgi:Phage terminase large subunit